MFNFYIPTQTRITGSKSGVNYRHHFHHQFALRYGSEYVYSKFREAGLTPEMPYAKDNSSKHASVDVYLIPLDGFNESVVNQIANIMSEELGINVKASLSAPLDKSIYNQERKQYIESSLNEPIFRVIPDLKNKTDQTAYIGLARSSDKASLMYSPLNGPADLEQIGQKY
ncbi:MAG: hypothetical protein GXY61_14480 [Lentisphaerae bacterium]|nr:hypothetical protein [Lentisphaerota bacterium]